MHNIYRKIDFEIKKKYDFRIKQKDLVKALDLTIPTYNNYMNGKITTGVKTILEMLSPLDDKTIVSIVREASKNTLEQRLNKTFSVVKEKNNKSSSIDFDKYYDSIYQYEKAKYMTEHGNKKGVVYTSRDMARNMLKLLNPNPDETLWDPSAGAGVFVIAVIEFMLNEKKLTPVEIQNYVECNLTISDINEDSINFLEKLMKSLFQTEFGINDIKPNCQIIDALLNQCSYHNIIANPPYIRTKNIDKTYLEFLRMTFDSCSHGNIDVYYAFLEMINKFSAKSCTVTPNSFLHNNSAKILRNQLAPFITYLRDYKEDKQFETASTYTAIMVLDKRNISDTFKYAEYKENWSEINRTKLNENKWNLSFECEEYDYNKRETHFKDIVDIYSGIATLSDKHYIVNKSDDNSKYYEKEFDNQVYFIEKELCVKFKKISKDFGKTENEEKYIIFPYTDINKIIPENEMMEKFPMAYEYLLMIKHLLLKRDKGKTSKYDAWYAYGRRQGFNYDFTAKEGYVVPLVYPENNFIYKEIRENERFIHTSGYILIPKKGYEEKVKNILKNGDLHTYLNLYGKKMPGKNINYNRLTATLLKDYPYEID